jgi:hypothetical protein
VFIDCPRDATGLTTEDLLFDAGDLLGGST